ncbi:MAG: hypothetical protein ACO1RT_19625 [Planctomycetaceae bacterium]
MPDLAPFLVDRLAPELAELIRAASMPSLAAGPRNQGLQEWLSNAAGARQNLSPEANSALWLLAGDLDVSHTISQSLETPDGSLLHAIMHRREGDFSNAKYWLRRASNHPVLAQLRSTDYGDASSFVDRCAAAVGTGSDQERQLEQSQWLEWQMVYARFT